MSNEEYIEQYPQFFKDDIDKWLFKEFNIIGGACSSVEELRYSVAREVAEKAMNYAKEQLMKDSKHGVVEDNYVMFDDNTCIDLDPSMSLNPGFKLNDGQKVNVLINVEG